MTSANAPMSQFAVVTRPVGVLDALRMFVTPRSVFARVEDTGAFGWAMVVLLVLVMLVGYAQVMTGLIDVDVDRQTEVNLAAAEKSMSNLVDRVQLRQSLDGVRKGGEFMKLMSRIGAVGLSPVYFLASFLLIASALYAAVALTGRKPEYHTLMAICVYAGFVELASYALRLAMMLYYRTTAVDTSLAGLGVAGEPTVFAAVDPFRIWFWVLVAMGLIVTRQLSRRAAIVSCMLMAVTAFGVRVAMEFAQHA